jgi:hypothetical protein
MIVRAFLPPVGTAVRLDAVLRPKGRRAAVPAQQMRATLGRMNWWKAAVMRSDDRLATAELLIATVEAAIALATTLAVLRSENSD